MDKDFRLAVKAFIVENNKIFSVKRNNEDVQSPGIWEIPGGRLGLGEDPTLGLKREVEEETGINIDVVSPLSVRHFERNDRQVITMIIFLCKKKEGNIKLSKEHIEYEWIDIDNAEKKLDEFFHKELNIYRRLKLKNLE